MARRVLLAEVGERTLWDQTRFGGNNAGGASGQTIYFNSPNLEVAKNAYRFAGMLYPDVGNVFSITPRAGGRLLFAVRATTLQDNGAYIGVCTQAFGVDTVPGFNGSGSPDNESWSIHTGGFSAGAGASYHGGVSGGGYTGTSMLTGEYVLVAVDLDQGKIWFGKATDIGGAPTWFYSGNPSTDTSPKYTNLLTAGSITDNRSTLLPGTKRAFYIVASAQDPNSIVHLVTDEPSLRSWLPTGFTPWGELGYFGSEGYTSRETDTPKSRYYDGRIADDADPVYERTVSVAQWSTGGSGGAPIGTFDLENPDGGLDALLTYVVRDAPIRWRLGDPAASLSTFTDVGYGVVETIEVADESRLTVVTKDTLAVVDAPLQSTVFPSDVPNAQLVGRAQPVCLGECVFVPLTTYSPANADYVVSDDAVSVTALRDQGVAISVGTGWNFTTIAKDKGFGIRRQTNPAGKQCAHVVGFATNPAATDALGGIGLFTNWTGDNPNGWTTSEVAPNAIITQTVAGECRFFRNDAVNVPNILTATPPLTVGKAYIYEVTCTNYVSGSINLNLGGANRARVDRAGTFRGAFVAATGNVWLLANIVNPTDLRIDNLRIYELSTVDRVNTMVPHVLQRRMSLPASSFDQASLDSLNTAASYALGFYTDQSGYRAYDLLQAIARSFTGGVWVDRLNKIKMGRLVAPTPGASVATFTDIELVGDVLVAYDLAPGLSDRLAGEENYAVHTEGEIAGSIYSSDRPLVETLKAKYQLIRQTATPLNGMYSHAKKAEPTPTLITDATNLQTEATRVGGLWSVPRRFFKFAASVDGGTGYLYEPFTVVTLQTDRYGLNAGLPVVLVSIRSRFLSDVVEFIAWG